MEEAEISMYMYNLTHSAPDGVVPSTISRYYTSGDESR